MTALDQDRYAEKMGFFDHRRYNSALQAACQIKAYEKGVVKIVNDHTRPTPKLFHHVGAPPC